MYATDGVDAEDLAYWGIQRMLDDVLEGGRLANCVSVWTRVIPGAAFSEADGLRLQYRRYLGMNGLYNGRYVCGEVPFEKDEELVRCYGGWRQSDGYEEEEGIYLRLHPKTSRGLLNRLCKAAMAFSQKADCNMELKLSYADYRRDYLNQHSENKRDVLAQSTLDKDADDREQRNFPDLRVYFTPEEKQMLLDYYPTLSRKFIQYADSSYTEDDLERIRFLWTLALLGELEGFHSARRCHWDSVRLMNGTFMNVFRKLPEKIRFELYGLCSFDLPENPKDYFRVLEEIPICNKVFFDKHSGIGDLSLMDDELYASIRREGYFVQVIEIHLKDIDDVHMMCDFMNKLKEIEQLAQTETGKPISCTEADERFNQSLSMQWWDFLNRNESAAGISEMTRREYHEQASKAALMDMNRLFTYNSDGLTFEPEESSQWARLRFRLEDGKYIYEIAQAEV